MEVMNSKPIGQRVLYEGDMANLEGRGVIVAVRENPNPARMYNVFAGMKPADNSVYYDMVLEDGRKIGGIMAGSFGGSPSDKSLRFMWLDGVASGEEVAGLLANAALVAAEKKAKADEAAAAFDRAKQEARDAGLKMGLIPVAEFKGRGSAAAFNLRKELKAAGIKARVVQDHYSAIRVKVSGPSHEGSEGYRKVIEGSDYAKAEAIGKKYEAGSFDGMSDCYEYRKNPWGDMFGDVRYVFVDAE